MSIESKYSYRFVYLKSEKWENVRLEALARDDARCAICGYRNLSNDAHHVRYPDSVWDTKTEDLIILCRQCHDFVHQILPMPSKGDKYLNRLKRVSRQIWKWANEIRSRDGSIVNPEFLTLAIEKRHKGCCRCKQKKPTAMVNVVSRFSHMSPVEWDLCESCESSLNQLELSEHHTFRTLRIWKDAIKKESR